MTWTSRVRDIRLVAPALTLVAIATRFQQYGNPIVHIDEQFYLLVGDHMLSGALPYVDIWDRKPIGLFLIYAAIRMLGGGGVWQYQLVATGFAIATALVVHQIALRLAGAVAALLAAILYLLWIPLLTGQGGQSPVFYNLFVALAAWIVLRLLEDHSASPSRLAGWGVAAMLLVGIALQIKYSALFEGFYFGLVLLWLARARMGWFAAVPVMALWVAAALLPTLVAMLAYWRLGHFDAFWFANFVSIFHRGKLDPGDTARNALTLSLYTAPLVILAASGIKRRLEGVGPVRDGWFVTGWAVVAAFSVLFFGYYFDHYALPFVAPACVSASAFLDDWRRRGWTIAILSGAMIACLLLPHQNQRRRGTPAEFAALTSTLKPYASRGLLVWDNLPALYYVLHAPLPTRFPFPTHLRDSNEVGAVGIDQKKELIRILDRRPAAVVAENSKPGSIVGATTVILRQRLARDYRLIARIKVGRRDQLVYRLDALP